jgi:hypothetical protein
MPGRQSASACFGSLSSAFATDPVDNPKIAIAKQNLIIADLPFAHLRKSDATGHAAACGL